MSGSKGLQRYVPRILQDSGMIASSEVAHYTHLKLVQYVKADDIDAALRRAKAEGLKEAEQYALTCLKELQDKICDIELGKYTLVGSQTKEGVAEWVHAKTLQAGRIAKWITARIAEVEDDARAAQIENEAIK